MADYLSRNEAINAIKSLESSMPAKDNYAKGYDAAIGRVLIAIREVPPAADVQPVKHAKWILFAKDNVGRAFYCSNCRKATTTDDFENSPLEREEYFCPRCGARMDGEQK